MYTNDVISDYKLSSPKYNVLRQYSVTFHKLVFKKDVNDILNDTKRVKAFEKFFM